VAVLTLVAVLSAILYGAQLRRAQRARVELWGKLHGAVPEMRTLLRNAHLLPLHDIRPERERVRALIADVETELHGAVGREAAALGKYVLGEGFLALGDHERALALLEEAWAAGERGAPIDAALGRALGIAYETRLEEAEESASAANRAAIVQKVEQRYRDPALAHLAAAVGTADVPAAYLEALILYHQHRFGDASARAQAAFAQSPRFYEAGMIEAKAQNGQAMQWLRAGKEAEAKRGFAEARQTFARVLEVARSDDEAWLGRAQVTLEQANALIVGGAMPEDLKQEVLASLRTAEQINPENGMAFLQEADIYSLEANIKINGDRDPRADVDKVQALANQARARAVDRAEVDSLVCIAQWELAVWQGRHAIDPHAAFAVAVAAGDRVLALHSGARAHLMLSVVYAALSNYEGQHGADPTSSFQLSEQHARSSLAIDDDPGTHYCLARLLAAMAHYQADHGHDPESFVREAIKEYETALRLNQRRADAAAGIADALAARAIDQLQRGEDVGPTLLPAQKANERALAIDPNLVVALKCALYLPALAAQSLLAHGHSPMAAIERVRAVAAAVLQRIPKDAFVHRLLGRSECLAARWALAHHGAVDAPLARAARELALAQKDDPLDAQSLAASAEVEGVRAELERRRGRSPTAALARGLGLAERALAIDRQLVPALRARQALQQFGSY
jgi:serine/threonine-protein kinase